jgi:site-specific recombinase XerD
MISSDIINAYLVARRAQGVGLRSAARLLRQFVRETGNVEFSTITPAMVEIFLRGHGVLSATWKTRHGALAGLYRFAIARGYVKSSPLPIQVPQLPPQQTPYVYSLDELERLLTATNVLKTWRSRLQVATYRMLLLILYGAGLRVSEAIGLRLCDVDVGQRVLTIRTTKFYKTRLVPVGPRLSSALAAYIELRCSLPLPEGQESALLCSRTGHRVAYQFIITQFQRVRAAAEIYCPAGEPRPPRLHDLRHTAAVHRVVAWYRAGKDVQRLLPLLATYLGHVDISSTQIYLQMTPELLQEASRRFAAYAQQENAHA